MSTMVQLKSSLLLLIRIIVVTFSSSSSSRRALRSMLLLSRLLRSTTWMNWLDSYLTVNSSQLLRNMLLMFSSSDMLEWQTTNLCCPTLQTLCSGAHPIPSNGSYLTPKYAWQVNDRQRLSYLCTRSGKMQFDTVGSVSDGVEIRIVVVLLMEIALRAFCRQDRSCGLIESRRYLSLLRATASSVLRQMLTSLGRKVLPSCFLTMRRRRGRGSLTVAERMKGRARRMLSASIIYCQWSLNNSNMEYNSGLYQQFLASRLPALSATARSRDLLHRCSRYSDSLTVTTEDSIEVLREVGVLSHITGFQDMIAVTERMREGTIWVDEPQMAECRFISFLWAVIDEESVEMRELKELLLILSGQQNRHALIQDIYGCREGVEEMIGTWDQLQTGGRVSRAGTSPEISDISIIKSKNEGDNNKENTTYSSNQPYSQPLKTVRRQTTTRKEQSKTNLPKSFHKRSHTTQRSSEKVTRRSVASSQFALDLDHTPFYVPEMSVEESKQLVDRLYRCDHYKERQAQKEQLEAERQRQEMEECTFKPDVGRKSRTMSKGRLEGKPIKGYSRAIERMKSGYQKGKELRENKQYRFWRQGNIPSASKCEPSAPVFAARPRQSEPQLFKVVFTVGRHKIPVKVRESDRIEGIVENVAKIYALKEEMKQKMRVELMEEISKYYEGKRAQMTGQFGRISQ